MGADGGVRRTGRLVGRLGRFVHLVQRETGIRFRSLGARANWMVVAIVVACLALFSVSLGLASLQLPWAVVATSLAAFAITTCLSGLALRSAVERAGRD